VIRERVLDLMNWVLLAVLVFIVVWFMEQSVRGFERQRYGFEIILPTPAPVFEQVEHFPS